MRTWGIDEDNPTEKRYKLVVTLSRLELETFSIPNCGSRQMTAQRQGDVITNYTIVPSLGSFDLPCYLSIETCYRKKGSASPLLLHRRRDFALKLLEGEQKSK